jgi:hypothetical protein
LPEVSEDLKPTFDALCTFFDIDTQYKVHLTSVHIDSDRNSDGSSEERSCLEYAAETATHEPAKETELVKPVVCTEREALWNEQHRLFDEIEQELLRDESRFLEEDVFVNSFACGETKDIVQLDVVNGDVIAVRRSTLRQYEGSVLSCQFDDTAWCQGEQDSGSVSDDGVMVEQPAYAFGKLIDQLRLMAMTPPDMKVPRSYIAPHEEGNFHAVVHYYFPGQEHQIIPDMDTFASDILDSKPHKLLLQEWIQESRPEPTTDVTLSLLYQASRLFYYYYYYFMNVVSVLP